MLQLPRVALAAVTVLVPIIVAVPAYAVAPSDPTLVAFHGTGTGTLSFVVIPPNRFATASGSGHATHLGRFDIAINITANLMPVAIPNCPTLGNNELNTTTFTSANGDAITVAGTGATCPTSPTTAVSMDTLQVVSGTGRFEGASGSIVVHGAINRTTLTFSVTYEGTLSTPGSIK